MKPILYSYFRSSCSYRVRIALNILGISYEYRPVHLVKNGGEQLKQDFLQLNPKGEVPFFVDGETSITQSMAIIDYLDHKHGKRQLFSSSPKMRAKCIELCEIINSGIQPLQNLKVMKTVQQNYALSDAQKMAWSKHWIYEGFKALEPAIANCSGTYSLGGLVSAVDCFLVPQVYNANRFGIDMSEFPNIKRVNENCLKLEAFQKAAPENQPDAPKS